MIIYYIYYYVFALFNTVNAKISKVPRAICQYIQREKASEQFLHIYSLHVQHFMRNACFSSRESVGAFPNNVLFVSSIFSFSVPLLLVQYVFCVSSCLAQRSTFDSVWFGVNAFVGYCAACTVIAIPAGTGITQCQRVWGRFVDILCQEYNIYY